MIDDLARVFLLIACLTLLALAGFGVFTLGSELSAVEGADIQTLIPTGAELADAWQTYRVDLIGIFLVNTMRVTLTGYALAVILGLVLATLMDFFPLV
ncbi:MAG: hypothetical protein AAFQ07_14740, partial [Chloroflexota bacterium]